MKKSGIIGAGIGAAGMLAIVAIVGAGDPVDLPYTLGGHEIEITQEDFDAIAAVYAAREIWAHDASGIGIARAHTREDGTHYAVVVGTVVAPANDPPEGDRVRVSPKYVEAIRAAKLEAQK